ncbi:hypothetical protein DBV39_19230 [Orrella marina]|uniref:Uncharacterized protein n=1 Tax=Orrella marina TaxID=2163011 RepID=A0A2R4XP06_9BURK|nr:hypothetical protein DBV39_19230 [Orrella marina]
MSWKTISISVMRQVYQNCKQIGETDIEKIKSKIDSSYPFGQRKHWPYKAWLLARKEFFAEIGLIGERKTQHDIRQESLF